MPLIPAAPELAVCQPASPASLPACRATFLSVTLVKLTLVLQQFLFVNIYSNFYLLPFLFQPLRCRFRTL